MLLSTVQICVFHILSMISRLLFFYLFFFSLHAKQDRYHSQYVTYTTQYTVFPQTAIPTLLFTIFFCSYKPSFLANYNLKQVFLQPIHIYTNILPEMRSIEGKYAVNVTVCAIVVIIKKRITIYSKNDMIVPDGCFSCTYKVKF